VSQASFEIGSNAVSGAANSAVAKFGALPRRYLALAQAEGLAQDVVRRSLLLSVLIILMMAAQPVLFVMAGLTYHPDLTGAFVLVGVVAAMLSQLCLRRYRDPFVGHLVLAYVHLPLGSLASVSLTYAVARLNLPLWDAELEAVDRALGLNWPAYAAFILADERLLQLAALAYKALDIQFMCAALVAVFALRMRAFQTFLIAYLVAALATSILSGLMPAFGTFHHYGMVEEMRLRLTDDAGFVHLPQLTAIRAGLPFDPSANFQGIVTFPSFHAAAGVLFAWFFWHVPLLRWPLLAINLCMIAATPLFGAHYFTDVAIGIALASLALVFARRIAK
jgi:membrane-associated phospholipid phosphatase